MTTESTTTTATAEEVQYQPGVAEKIAGLKFVDPKTGAKISPLTVDALTAMTAQDLMTVFGVNAADAFNVKSRFVQSATLQVEVDTTAAAQTATTNGQQANPFASLLTGGASASGLSSGVMSAKVNPEAIGKAADAVLACTIWGGGIYSAFGKDFWAQVNLGTEWELRSTIDAWLEDMDSGRYISATSIEQLFKAVQGLFGPKFDQLIQSVSVISQTQSTQALTGAVAMMNIGDNMLGNLQMTVPYVAEELSTAMIASRTPEQAGRLVRSVQTFFTIVRNPKLQARTGIVDAANTDEGALQFIRQRLGQQAARRVQLAMAYESFVRALALCNEANAMDPNYLKTVGILASRLSVLYTMSDVASEAQTVQSAAPFQGGTPAHATASASASARVKFSLNLGSFNVTYK